MFCLHLLGKLVYFKMKKKLLLASFICIGSLANAQTYSSTGSVAINDGPGACGTFSTPASSIINVPLTGTIGTPADVTINLGLDHPFVGDIDIEIVAPDASSCFLLNHIGAATCSGASDNFISTNVLSFNSTYATLVPTTGVSSTNVPAGNYAPTGSTAFPSVCNLATFLLGKSVNGNWAIRGRDHFGSQIGTMTSWNIVFGATALPLELLSFSGSAFDGHNMLKWETGVEKGMSHIEVERSFDAITFSTLANVQTKGTSSTYSYSDALGTEGNVFYRLRLVDFDGKSSYSNTVKLSASNTKGTNSLKLNPNPTKGILTLTVKDKNLVGTEAKVIDQVGKIVHSFEIKSETQSIDFSQYPPAFYTIRLDNGDILKFVKQD
jgi:subtilisin-like proprotein convertase family protein